jgi:aryl-alcohol dehydrogenase-like predicted oxidoreductase
MLSPEHGEAAVPGSGTWLSRLRALCDAWSVAPIAAALQFAATESGADFLLVGVDSADQLREVIASLESARIPADFLRLAGEQFTGVPPRIADPRRWRGAA